MRRSTHFAPLAVALGLALGTASGCSSAEPVDHSQALRLTFRPVQGTIVAPTLPDTAVPTNVAYIVVLYQGAGELFELHNYRVYRAPGLFTEVLPAGEYRLAAFEDTNGNFAYDVGERFGQLDDGETIWGGGAESRKVGVVLSLDTTGACDLPPGVVVFDPALHSKLSVNHPTLMAIDPLDRDRSAPAGPTRGAWAPLDAVRAYGAGLYSFGAPDPRKTPIVFVHSAPGAPDQWKAIIHAVDGERFQPWIYHYDAALPLQLTSWSFSCMIDEAVTRFGLPPCVVAAHAAGGCVARSMIRWQIEGGRAPAIERLITIASPFGGHPDPRFGATWVSDGAGYWRDLAPESAFLTWLYDTTWPDNIAHYLIIAVGGTQNPELEHANDGTVPVPSQIDPRIQRHAAAVAVVADEHAHVLVSAEGMHHFFRFVDDGREIKRP